MCICCGDVENSNNGINLMLIKRCGYARTRVADTFMENTSGEEGSQLKTHRTYCLEKMLKTTEALDS